MDVWDFCRLGSFLLEVFSTCRKQLDLCDDFVEQMKLFGCGKLGFFFQNFVLWGDLLNGVTGFRLIFSMEVH